LISVYLDVLLLIIPFELFQAPTDPVPPFSLHTSPNYANVPSLHKSDASIISKILDLL